MICYSGYSKETFEMTGHLLEHSEMNLGFRS